MLDIIKKLLSECGYIETAQPVSFYSKNDKSHFFMIALEEDEFAGLKNKDLIRENASYKAALDGVSRIVSSGERPTVEKNSSLVIIVRCGSIDALSHLQQQILLFEEDEYFFKKYIILYTDASIAELTDTPLLPALHAKVNDNVKFDTFATQGYVVSLAEFIVVIQLFIKLPFLNLNHGTESFTPLVEKITNALDNRASLYNSLLEHADQLATIDFTKPEHEELMTEILSMLPHD